MSRSTIDFGIDLGTTNSAIAVLDGVQPEIIKNNEDQDVTPSAVWINKQGVVRVGSRAKGATAGDRSVEDSFTEFKRQMGTPHQYSFRSAGVNKKPDDLSAEVLKELRSSVEAKTGEVIDSAVITVPAAFELHQCDATRRAAELAGFRSSSLLQEPVAAALAYGFQADAEKAYWMVYDFGGGTFDAALIKAEEGMINVIHHGGDNFLGGSDIDWAIIDKILIPQLIRNFDLPGFARGSERWEIRLRQIKHEVEKAKIELSTKEVTSLSGGLVFEDLSGESVECDELSFSRADLIRVAEPLINRSIAISQQVLKEKNLGLHAIQRVIVVGGPTKAPYFRDILSNGLRIPIDFSQDPLTVVARGASVFAGTQKRSFHFQKKAAAGEYQIQISDNYKTVGHEVDPLIAGKVTSPADDPTNGFRIEFVNPASKWRSGQIPLNAEGVFLGNLLAEKGCRNVFQIELTDAQGALQKVVPDHVVYTIGAVIEEQPLLKSIGLGKADNTVDWFFKSGTGLPQKKRWPGTHRITVALNPGEAGEAVEIPIVEGEYDAADRNRLVGLLKIDSSMVRRALPAGSELEITLRIDESRTIVLEAYFPALDEEFSKQLDIEKAKADAEEISKTLEKEKERMRQLIRKAEIAGEHALADELDKLQTDKDRDELVQAAKGDQAAAEKAAARVLELQNTLDRLEKEVAWPAMVIDARKLQTDLSKLAENHGSPSQQQKAEDWTEVIEQIIGAKQAERLSRKIQEGESIYFQILFSLPSYWVGAFRRMESERAKFTQADAADRLLERGREYLQKNNIEGLTDVVRKLWKLLPKEEMEKAQRGVGTII